MGGFMGGIVGIGAGEGCEMPENAWRLYSTNWTGLGNAWSNGCAWSDSRMTN